MELYRVKFNADKIAGPVPYYVVENNALAALHRAIQEFGDRPNLEISDISVKRLCDVDRLIDDRKSEDGEVSIGQTKR